MNIKSLILGSAISALAVNGSKAADAIVFADPEPVEYVRVCDVYGAGFFYIPGTETCLRVSGYVYHQFGATSWNDIGDTASWSGTTGTRSDSFTSRTRGRVNFDARSETQYGTLRSYVRFQSDMTENGHNAANTSSDGSAVVDQAWLSLGGFLVGYTNSAFYTSNLVGSLTTGTGFADDTVAYSDHQRQMIQYNFKGSNGFFGVVSIENDPDDGSNYMPDLVGKIGVQQGWGAAWLTVGVDEESWWTGDTEFAVKAGLHYNIPGMRGSAFRLVGHYNSDANSYQQGGNQAASLRWSSEWSVYAGYNHQFNPQVAAWIGGAYYNDVEYVSGWDGFHVETGLTWTPVKDFQIRAEAVYAKMDPRDGTLSGFLRFTRSF
jgi:hypothetical protein